MDQPTRSAARTTSAPRVSWAPGSFLGRVGRPPPTEGALASVPTAAGASFSPTPLLPLPTLTPQDGPTDAQYRLHVGPFRGTMAHGIPPARSGRLLDTARDRLTSGWPPRCSTGAPRAGRIRGQWRRPKISHLPCKAVIPALPCHTPPPRPAVCRRMAAVGRSCRPGGAPVLGLGSVEKQPSGGWWVVRGLAVGNVRLLLSTAQRTHVDGCMQRRDTVHGREGPVCSPGVERGVPREPNHVGFGGRLGSRLFLPRRPCPFTTAHNTHPACSARRQSAMHTLGRPGVGREEGAWGWEGRVRTQKALAAQESENSGSAHFGTLSIGLF
jgi:hypothetical protein